MAIHFSLINGKSTHIDSDYFCESIREGLEPTCSDAKLYLFNNFPVAISEETNIDLLLILVLKDIQGNYFKFGQGRYLKNLIMPISFIDGYQKSKIRIADGGLLIDNAQIDFHQQAKTLDRRLRKYLIKKVGLQEAFMTTYSLFFIKNDRELFLKNHLVASEFNFEKLVLYLQSAIKADKINSYSAWNTKNSNILYEDIAEHINQIVERAAVDSRVGYLTRRKIQRIGNKLNRKGKKEDALNNSLVIISGKAGTGKTTELLSLMLKSLLEGRNVYYLTYNKLLVYDLAKTIKGVLVEKNLENSEISGQRSIKTLHSFFYQVSQRLGVLLLMSEERVKELLEKQKKRLGIIYRLIKNIENDKHRLSDKDLLMAFFQNEKSIGKDIRDLGIRFVRYSFKRRKDLVNSRDETFKEYYEFISKQISNMAQNEIFLKDYYEVLRKILRQLEDPAMFYEENGIEKRVDLLYEAFNLNAGGHEQNKLTQKKFVEKHNRKIGGFRRGRTIFIDEAQDCHQLEKDILIKIYGSNNIVIASGGVEQLIRHMELCNWEYSDGNKLKTTLFRTTNKSYRVKPQLLELCMFVAQKYSINLDLQPFVEEDGKSSDIGKIVLDFRPKLKSQDVKVILDDLVENASIHGNNVYESAIVMIDTHNMVYKKTETSYQTSTNYGKVNEFDNIDESFAKEREGWVHYSDEEFSIWDGTKETKGENGLPLPDEIRVIFYESCRGLEAWSTLCLSVDKFFDRKHSEDEAESFLITDEAKVLTKDLFLSNEDRKKMYAATWILMAITRAMDSLYLHIEDKNSEFGKTIVEYLNTSPKNVKVIRG